jgi:hypothetical protein
MMSNASLRSRVGNPRIDSAGRRRTICRKEGVDPGDREKDGPTAEAEAARNHLAGVVAVVDDGGWPILIERIDHAAYIAASSLRLQGQDGCVVRKTDSRA